jgi:L-fucose isomerase-like protein
MMDMYQARKSRFAIYLGNRGFFPKALLGEARTQLVETLAKLGYETIIMDEKATRYGAIETREEGLKFASFLQANRGKFDGVILSLPNFGDENGAIVALAEAHVPILVQAYPDELDKMAPALRRDAFCGKMSIMDVFHQRGIPFTALEPHTVRPGTRAFERNIDYFDRLCRVHSGMKDLRVGAVGARTTAFKTVRIDEIALQSHGIAMETYDLSTIFRRIDEVRTTSALYKAKFERLSDYADWKGAPDEALVNLTKLGVVMDELIEQEALDCVAIRCWNELQKNLGVSPCVLLSEMNDRGMAAGCELDVGSALMMYALSLASGREAACLDWNNNYADEDDKCILFHCGPVPQGMMTAKGRITDHDILAVDLGPGCGWGCDVGRIAPGAFSYGNLLTEDGKIKTYVGRGEFTADSVPAEFFGSAGVASIPGLQSVLRTIGYAGFRHHVSVTPADAKGFGAENTVPALAEAFSRYLGYEVLRV